MADESQFIAEKVIFYRDRFSAWGLVVSFVAFVAAVWTTAPTLEVDLPLVGGTNISLNVGYVLAAGMPFIGLAQAWLLGPILAMRSYQRAAARIVEKGKELPEAHRLAIEGKFVGTENLSHFETLVTRLSLAFRLFILFIVPVLASLVIGIKYFGSLHVYHKGSVVSCITDGEPIKSDSEGLRDQLAIPCDCGDLSKESRGNADEWRINPKRRISFAEYFFYNNFSSEATFVIPNSDLERDCAQGWVNALPESGKPQEGGMNVSGKISPQKTPSCVVSSFPRFILVLNSWVNLIGLSVTIVFSVFGIVTFLAWRPKAKTSSIANMEKVEI